MNPADPRMMQGFGFDEADLAANRAGRISERQLHQLARERADLNKKMWGCLGGLLVPSGILILIALMTNGRVPNPSPVIGGSVGLGSFVLVVAIMVAGVAAFIIFTGRRASRDWKEGRAEAIEGIVKLDVVNTKTDHYIAKINGKTFNISKLDYDALNEQRKTDGAEAVYRVYYAPGNQKLLSIEKRV